jgi:hypothetical protein
MKSWRAYHTRRGASVCYANRSDILYPKLALMKFRLIFFAAAIAVPLATPVFDLAPLCQAPTQAHRKRATFHNAKRLLDSSLRPHTLFRNARILGEHITHAATPIAGRSLLC